MTEPITQAHISMLPSVMGLAIFFLLISILLIVSVFLLYKLIIILYRINIKKKMSKIDFNVLETGDTEKNRKIIFNAKGYPVLYLEKNKDNNKIIVSFF